MTPHRSRTSTSSTPGKRWGRRIVLGAVALAVLWFAVEGGEYGTTDLFTQQDRREALEAEVAVLRAEVESLKAELKAVTRDPVRIERIAREQFGMVRGDKEILYWTRSSTSDSANVGSDSVDAGTPDGDASH